MNNTVLGLIAGTLSAFSFIPQVITVWDMKPKPAAAISLPMYVIFTTASVLWIIYGIRIKSVPVWLVNVVIVVLALFVIAYKCIYG